MDQHIALFYDDKKYLISSLKNFLQIGIEAGETAALLITEDKWVVLKAELLKIGFPIDALIASRQIVYVDARKFLTALCPEFAIVPEESFNKLISSELGNLILGPRTRWYGEIVSLLCDRGQADVAVQLEGYWNSFLAKHSNVFLFCGYSADAIDKSNSKSPKNAVDICCSHSNTVISSPSFTNLVRLKDYSAARIEKAPENGMDFT